MEYVLILENQPVVHKNHCCNEMSRQVELGNCGDTIVSDTRSYPSDKRVFWSSLFDEYGLVNSSAPEVSLINYCPFCGDKKSKSKRDAWFTKLESLSWAQWGDPIPDFMFTVDWEND